MIIGDGTGTEVVIPAGTSIEFPPGSDSVISYTAPLVQGDDLAKPADGEFTDIQRELQPSGLIVGIDDTIIVNSRYHDQDVVGLDEEALVPYYFIDAEAGGATDVGDSMVITKRDTANNVITFAMQHFSMFRLASVRGGITVSRAPAAAPAAVATGLVSLPNPLRATANIVVRVADTEAGQRATVALYDLGGSRVAFKSAKLPAGLNAMQLKGRYDHPLSRGTYVLEFRMGGITHSRRVTVTR